MIQTTEVTPEFYQELLKAIGKESQDIAQELLPTLHKAAEGKLFTVRIGEELGSASSLAGMLIALCFQENLADKVEMHYWEKQRLVTLGPIITTPPPSSYPLPKVGGKDA